MLRQETLLSTSETDTPRFESSECMFHVLSSDSLEVLDNDSAKLFGV